MAVTSPDNIYVHDGSGPASLTQISQSEGSSVQAALDKRQRYTFYWANSAARTAQTGMRQGDLGYQIDTKSEYKYDNSVWMLGLAYAEWTASQAIGSGGAGAQSLTSLTYDSGYSTSATMTSQVSGHIVLTDPGIYGVSWIGRTASSVPANSGYFAIYSDGAQANLLGISALNTSANSVVIPFHRTLAANSELWFFHYQTTGGTITFSHTIKIGRIG